MRTVTRSLLLLVAFVATATSARAQQVTFQVDMTSAINNCAFTAGTDSVFVRGSFNDWGNTQPLLKMSDADSDKIYTSEPITATSGTVINYKFYSKNEATVGWENDPNRAYTVTSDPTQVVSGGAFNKTFTNACGAKKESVEIEFRVDMSVARLGSFNPATDIVTVAGTMNGWSTTRDTLFQDLLNPNLYVGLVSAVDSQAVPGEIKYKFVTGKPGGAPAGWESVPDRVYTVAGTLSDTDNNGRKEIVVPVSYFDNVTPNDVFTAQTTITYEVNFRPAFYFLADNNRLPSDTQTGDPVTQLSGLWINGPAAGKSDGLTDWATWGTDLASITSRRFLDNGTQGDRVAGDSIFSAQFTYPAGTPKKLAGKFGASGFDNEGGFGADHRFDLDAASQSNGRVMVVFGAPLLITGKYTDVRGPAGFTSAYDRYICISGDSTAMPTVARSGCGTSTAIGDDNRFEDRLALGSVYPNPVSGRASVEFTLAKAGRADVRVIDLMGREVAVLAEGVYSADRHTVSFDAGTLPAGVYLIRLQADGAIHTRSLVVVR